MREEEETREQLISELAEIRQRIAKLEESETQRKWAEKGQSRSAAIMNKMIDVVGIINEEGIITQVNNAVETWGYKIEDIIGKSPVEFITRHSLPNLMMEKERTERGKIIRNLELVGVKKDRSEFPILVNVIPMMGTEGQITGCVFSLRDIAKGKRGEEMLRENERRFGDIAENTSEWIWEVDTKGKYIYTNSSVEKILGYRPEEVLTKHFYDLFHPKDREEMKKLKFEVFAKKQPFREFINRRVCKNGKTIWLSTKGVPIFDEKADLLGYRGTGVDITERKQAEEKLKQSFKDLRSHAGNIIQVMAQMAAEDPHTVGHQWRTANLACAIAKEMNFSEEQVKGIRMAGVIHDIGKTYIPAEILNKPTQLSEVEFSVVKTHPQIGYDILKVMEFPWRVAQITLQHHERMDGSGYPAGLSGEEIMLEARILSVADVVEAMLSQRPYRLALSIEETLEKVLQSRGILYDPKVVDTCLKLFTEKGFRLK